MTTARQGLGRVNTQVDIGATNPVAGTIQLGRSHIRDVNQILAAHNVYKAG